MRPQIGAMRSLALILALPLLLNTCADRPGAQAGACPAPELSELVGQMERAAEGVSYDGTMRIIRPGMMVTMDHDPARLNFEIGEDGRITRVYCG